MEPDWWVQGRATVTQIATKKNGLNLRGVGFDRFFKCSEEGLATIKVGQTVKFKCSITYNEFEKAYRVGELYSIVPEAPGTAAKAS